MKTMLPVSILINLFSASSFCPDYIRKGISRLQASFCYKSHTIDPHLHGADTCTSNRLKHRFSANINRVILPNNNTVHLTLSEPACDSTDEHLCVVSRAPLRKRAMQDEPSIRNSGFCARVVTLLLLQDALSCAFSIRPTSS